ncbi:MAG: histidine phosphatase family protein [Candidatus Micrarchaeota archaeon]
MPKLVLLRHGRSVWNVRNLFTGWVDIPLAVEGRRDALAVATKLRDYSFDAVFTSNLVRAVETMLIACSKFPDGKFLVIPHGKPQERHKPVPGGIPVHQDDALNERHYGDLQGLDKAETARVYGEAHVRLWRRSFRTRPPGGESLEDTCNRTLPYFHKKIVPLLKKGENVLVVAHGNSLRSIVMELDRLSEDEVVALEIPFDKFIEYDYRGGRWGKKRVVWFPRRRVSIRALP